MRVLFQWVLTGGLLAAGTVHAQTWTPPPPSSRPFPGDGTSGPIVSDPNASPPGQLEIQFKSQQAQIETLSKTVQLLTEQLHQTATTSPPSLLSATSSTLLWDGPALAIAPPLSDGFDLQPIQLVVAEPSEQPAAAPPPTAENLQKQLELQRKQIEVLEKMVKLLAKPGSPVAAPPPTAPTAENLQKQLELQRKQIEVLEKMVKLLAGQLERQGPAVGKLQTDVATLEGRGKQGAQRDQQLANGLDNLTEQMDALRRYGPQLPAPLKELFDPSYNNETPLSIYGQVVERYHEFNGRSGVFESPAISPFFLLTLNQWIFLEANVDLSNVGVDVPFAQIDFLLNDHATAVVGRYLLPIGFYNERLNAEWINKMYDSPLMFRQVSPLASTDGAQLRGSSYIFGSPVKMEYSLYGGNGMQLSGPPGSLADLADLSVLANSDEVHAKAMGGRLGLWVPQWGVNGGVSGYYDHNYSLSSPNLNLGMVSVDASYHRGNWDARFEGAFMKQQAAALIGHDIHRAGMYAQLAYRRYDLPNGFFQKLEFVGRFSLERFTGIDPTQLDFSTFQNPTYVPVDRNQYAFSVNYYWYPSGIIKFGYEINQELHGINLHDNVFFGQAVWAF